MWRCLHEHHPMVVVTTGSGVSEVNVGGGVVEVALVLLEKHRQEEEKEER